MGKNTAGAATFITAVLAATAGCGLLGPSGTKSLIRGEVTDRVGTAIAGVLVEVLDGPLPDNSSQRCEVQVRTQEL